MIQCCEEYTIMQPADIHYKESASFSCLSLIPVHGTYTTVYSLSLVGCSRFSILSGEKKKNYRYKVLNRLFTITYHDLLYSFKINTVNMTSITTP